MDVWRDGTAKCKSIIVQLGPWMDKELQIHGFKMRTSHLIFFQQTLGKWTQSQSRQGLRNLALK